MQIKRIITAEGQNGVATRTDSFDTSAIDFLTNLWGFDRVPDLPVRQEEVLGEFQKLGIFGPPGSMRIDLFTLPPETEKGPGELRTSGPIDMGTPAMIPGEGEGMHRTDSIDLAIVLGGEVTAGYPGEDGKLHEVMMTTGDLMVTNGTFHSWRNRSGHDCTILFVVFGAVRKTA
ncbi:cupin domain-containing protein [Mucilaginibacter corticis]|uniref:Cupin domain-containing protein n=2 Tax=Mucilaginibacter corticis TaxID=2597670 RepID=A0A556M9C7_9SPHI|nr:cupin domain-containing protein [Mucilaginibacter corticis]